MSWSQRRHARRFSGVRSSAESDPASGSTMRHRLHLLAALAVDVDDLGLELHERLAPRGGGAQAVDLAAKVHAAGNIAVACR